MRRYYKHRVQVGAVSAPAYGTSFQAQVESYYWCAFNAGKGKELDATLMNQVPRKKYMIQLHPRSEHRNAERVVGVLAGWRLALTTLEAVRIHIQIQTSHSLNRSKDARSVIATLRGLYFWNGGIDTPHGRASPSPIMLVITLRRYPPSARCLSGSFSAATAKMKSQGVNYVVENASFSPSKTKITATVPNV
ncbi:hypothetical protein BDZ94DRAFT_1237690 [Collybia nuda]|uniref:Uncharacterized protein n=1 Tax=Collybia nuda TaxID=64659 RepID=A0A9P5Y2E2_9AGAR|nr:hypothetical protein BDZ94DRAFT_1237690 [Collybia nuda]